MKKSLLFLAFTVSTISFTTEAAPISYTRVFDELGAFRLGQDINTDVSLPDGDSISIGGALSETNVSINSDSSEYGSRSAFAQADLENRSLKANASASENTQKQYASGASVQALAVAEFGDSFSFQNSNDNSLFMWEQSDNFTFNLDVTGFFSGTNINRNQTTISLVLFESGGLSDYLSGDLNQEGTDILAVDSFIDQYFWTFDHDSDLCEFQSYVIDELPCNATEISSNNGLFEESLTASFNPGGDFDWFLSLRTGGSIYLNNDSASLESDFANSVYVDYKTPDGVNTISQSGLLSKIKTDPISVPEPSIVALMGIGLAGMGFARRRKQKV